jgi:hypothetical protein
VRTANKRRGELILLLSLTSLLLFAPQAHALGPVVYDGIPSPLPGDAVLSLAFEAGSTQEFGDLIQLSSPGIVGTVEVVLSSFGCEAGHWYSGDCATTPGATFSHPITLNLYNAGAGGLPGTLITSVTQTFSIPFRPSADPVHCTGANAGLWYSAADKTCYYGVAAPIEFDLSALSLMLPAQIVYGIAYDTTSHGYAPIGPAPCRTSPGGCGYDGLNVGLTDKKPSVGKDLDPYGMYWNTSVADFYCDGGFGGVDMFRNDTAPPKPCWKPYSGAIRISLAAASSAIPFKFNSSPIASGRYIWFSSVLKAKGPGSSFTITAKNATIQFTADSIPYTVPVPDARITFSSSATTATTDFVAGEWVTTVPLKLGGNMFLSGVPFLVPVDLPGSISPVTWTADFSSDTPDVSLSWQWGAAVYTMFNADPGALGVKPVDDSKASIYKNSDHAGTPENYKSPQPIKGATGGGGSNYVGGYSGTGHVDF